MSEDVANTETSHIETKDREDASNQDNKEYRLTLRLSPEAKRTLEWLAEERSTNYGEVIRRALGTERFFLEAANRKASILIEEEGKKTKEILFKI